jgi:hypothetical protein
LLNEDKPEERFSLLKSLPPEKLPKHCNKDDFNRVMICDPNAELYESKINYLSKYHTEKEKEEFFDLPLMCMKSVTSYQCQENQFDQIVKILSNGLPFSVFKYSDVWDCKVSEGGWKTGIPPLKIIMRDVIGPKGGKTIGARLLVVFKSNEEQIFSLLKGTLK